MSGGVSGDRNELLVDSVDDRIGIREECLLKLVSRSDPVARTECNCRSVEVVERELLNVGSHVLHDGVSLAGIADDEDLSGLLDRLDDLGVIERNDGTCVDDLSGNSVLLLKGLCSLKRSVKNRADGEDGNVLDRKSVV